jgi:cysteine-rich repeat protein
LTPRESAWYDFEASALEAKMLRVRCLRIVSATAAWFLLTAVHAAHAVDLTGSWWVHSDPYSGRSNFTSVTFDVVQSGNSLTLTNVTTLDPWGTEVGYGDGTIDPTTGVFDARYGFVVLFEPIGTLLRATASLDGSAFTGEVNVRLVAGTPLASGPVVGIRLTGEPPVCGNGRLEPGETCDDGNRNSNDGCSASCVREPRCGDRIRDEGEDCDDGNRMDDDGCSAFCVREPHCGDGVPDPGEECDDGNSNEADTCSSACLRLTRCGNSIVEFGEHCDDGNLLDADCCSASCRFTSNICRPSASRCDPREVCSWGVCPPDTGTSDADLDQVCDTEDMCRNLDQTRGFLARSRLMLANVNDDVIGNERLLLRATFDLSPRTPFDDYDPTAGLTIIQITAPRSTVFEVILHSDEYDGPGTRGWSRHPTRRQWLWRDETSAPIKDVLLVSITAAQTTAGDRVSVRVDARAHGREFGVPKVIPVDALPLQSSITLGSFFYGLGGRCGQSRFTAGQCVFDRRTTHLTCQ